jgi:predicted polyphosphate/ATP-dependent NAD kinase
MTSTMGLIVNPIAGMGGRVGLKGTDGAAALRQALALGAVPEAGARARRALAQIRPPGTVLAFAGEMGQDTVRAAGLAPEVVGAAVGATTASDTRRAAEIMAARGVALILFAGGDGTARDVAAVVGDRLPILGIPTGVKMHSGVFATGPESAGRLAALFLGGEAGRVRLCQAEVMDVDEQALRAGRISARLFGYALVPHERRLLQNAKSGAPGGDEGVLAAACSRIAAELEPAVVYLFGPGTTTRLVMEALGLEGTLLGVDAVRDGRLVGTDLGEREILALLDRSARIVVGVTGGQGFLFGRGNQQLGPEVIRRVGRENVLAVASTAKLLALAPRRLLVETGDPAVDAMLAGWLRVRTGPDQTMLMRVDPA